MAQQGAPITANLHYSCSNASSQAYSSPVSRREPFEEKVKKFCETHNINAFGTRNALPDGALFQLQKPQEWNLYFYDLGTKKGKPDYIEDFLVVSDAEAGCYNYVASFRESKNSGRYQRLAKRVLASQTYFLHALKGGGYHQELLLDNDDWLDSKKSAVAFDKLAACLKLKYSGDVQIVECFLHLSHLRVEIKAARCRPCRGKDGHLRFVVMSLNSGKMWVLDAKQCEIGRDVSQKLYIMSIFFMLKNLGQCNYIRVS